MIEQNLSESVWMHDGVIQYLDETQLPCSIQIGAIRTLSDAQKAIAELRIRALGQVFLILYLVVDKIDQNPNLPKELLRSNIKSIEQGLAKVRPTFPFEDIVKPYIAFLDDQASSFCVAADLKNKILVDLKTLKAKRIKRAQWVAQLLHNGDSVLTHCNTSGDMVILAQTCEEAGKSISFYVTETRPHLQGARLTSWELANAGIPVTLISDSAVARTIAAGRVQVAITGADRCALNGDIINKVGTFQIAMLCKAYGIPFYVMAQAPSNVASGRQITIEYRKGEEIMQIPRQMVFSTQIDALFPCFDITPAAYIDRIINFDGVRYPHELKSSFRGPSAWI